MSRNRRRSKSFQWVEKVAAIQAAPGALTERNLEVKLPTIIRTDEKT